MNKLFASANVSESHGWKPRIVRRLCWMAALLATGVSYASPQVALPAPDVVGDGEFMYRFRDETELELTSMLASQCRPIDIELRDERAGVVTLFGRFNQVVKAETEHDNAMHSEPRSEFYELALEKGWIKEIVESDGSTSFDYAVCKPGYSSSLNENGLVVVGDRLFQFTSMSLKVCPYAGVRSVEAIKATQVTSGDIVVIPVLGLKSTSYNWSNAGSPAYWDNNKRRATLSVVGTSYASGGSLLECQYYVQVKVEKKKVFGSGWNYGDVTCCYLYTSWQFVYGIQKSSIPFQCKSYYSVNGATSPVTHTFPTTYWPTINNLVLNLQPNGLWTTKPFAGYNFCDAVNVYKYSFTGSVCGGSSGINLNSLIK